MKLNSHLQFNGNCEEALKFYEKVFGSGPAWIMRWGESPMAAESPKELHSKILHGRIAFGENIIMACDAPPDRYSPPAGFCINIGVKTPEEAERLFTALSENAKITMPIQETFWALRFGMLEDQFGVPWMVNCEKPM